MSEAVAYMHADHGNTTVYLRSNKPVTFHQHLFTTSDPELIDLLDNHSQYGKSFQRIETHKDLDKLKEADHKATKYGQGPAATVMSVRSTRIDVKVPPKSKPKGKSSGKK